MCAGHEKQPFSFMWPDIITESMTISFMYALYILHIPVYVIVFLLTKKELTMPLAVLPHFSGVYSLRHDYSCQSKIIES